MIDPKAMEAARRIVDAHDAVEKAKGETHPSFKDAVQGLAYYEMHAANREGVLTVARALLAGEGNNATAAAVPFDQGLTHQPALRIVRGLRAIFGTYPMVMEGAAEIERLLGANIVLLAGLHKICEPITAMGDADSVSACQDLHELICMTAQEAISRAALI